jgi:hypothetical protein
MKELVINRLKQLIVDSGGDGIPRDFDCTESNYITDPDELNGLSDDALLDVFEASLLGYF